MTHEVWTAFDFSKMVVRLGCATNIKEFHSLQEEKQKDAPFCKLGFDICLFCWEGMAYITVEDRSLPSWNRFAFRGASSPALLAFAQRLCLDQLRSLRLDVFKESGHLPERPQGQRF
jgi:hypothetical protein